MLRQEDLYRLEDAILGVLYSPAISSYSDGTIYPDFLKSASAFQAKNGRITLFSRLDRHGLWTRAIGHWDANHTLPDYALAAADYEARSGALLPDLTVFTEAALDYGYAQITTKGEVGKDAFDLWLSTLLDEARLRYLSKNLAQLGEALSTPGTGWTSPQAIDKLNNLLGEFSLPSEGASPKPMLELVGKALDYNQDVQEGKIKPAPIRTGDASFDSLISPIRGQFGVVIGVTFAGKTTWASWFVEACVRHALSEGTPLSTLLLSYEVAEHQIACRKIEQISGGRPIPFSVAAVTSGCMPPRALDEAWHHYGSGEYWSSAYQYFSFLSAQERLDMVVAQLESQILSWIATSRRNEYDPSIVIIDYAQTMLNSLPEYEKNSAGTRIGTFLREMAAKNNLLILILSQVTSSIISNAITNREIWFEANAIEWFKTLGNTASYVFSIVPLLKMLGKNHPYVIGGNEDVVHFYCSKNSIGPMRPDGEGNGTGILPMTFDISTRSYQTIDSYSDNNLFPGNPFDGSLLLPKPVSHKTLT